MHEGMDAALQINPYYGKTSKAGILAHFGALLDFGPTIVYNVPARTAQDIPPELMLQLAEHENFAGEGGRGRFFVRNDPSLLLHNRRLRLVVLRCE